MCPFGIAWSSGLPVNYNTYNLTSFEFTWASLANVISQTRRGAAPELSVVIWFASVVFISSFVGWEQDSRQ